MNLNPFSFLGSKEKGTKKSTLKVKSGLNRQTFIEANINTIVSNLLYDALFNTINTENTKVPIYPLFVREKESAKANSLFEVCRQALIKGSVDYVYLAQSHLGFVFNTSISEDLKDYKVYTAYSPYSMEGKAIGIEELLRIPLAVLYEAYNSLFLKKEMFSNKLIIFIDSMRTKLSDGDGAKLDDNKAFVEEQVAQILDPTNNAWVLDGKDRVTAPSLIDDDLKEVITFAYVEIARILGVPLTRLIGKSPEGMNSTGEADANNYDLTLYKISNGLIYPVLKTADANAKLKQNYKMEDFRNLMQVINAVETINSISDEQKNLIIENILNSLGIKSDGTK